jgi:hypothetical protein
MGGMFMLVLMKSLQKARVAKIIALVLLVLQVSFATAADEKKEDDVLYYAAEKPFSEKPPAIEIRLGLTYDITNPYMNVFGPRLSALYNFSPFFSFGIEGTYYFGVDRGASADLSARLERHGFTLDQSSPDYGLMGVFRVTPLSGLLNLFSSSVMQTQVSLLARGGTIHYTQIGLGPSLGTGLELGTYFASGVGLIASVVWDWDLPSEGAWLNRTGFNLGGAVRF